MLVKYESVESRIGHLEGHWENFQPSHIAPCMNEDKNQFWKRVVGQTWNMEVVYVFQVPSSKYVLSTKQGIDPGKACFCEICR